MGTEESVLTEEKPPLSLAADDARLLPPLLVDSDEADVEALEDEASFREDEATDVLLCFDADELLLPHEDFAVDAADVLPPLFPLLLLLEAIDAAFGVRKREADDARLEDDAALCLPNASTRCSVPLLPRRAVAVWNCAGGRLNADSSFSSPL